MMRVLEATMEYLVKWSVWHENMKSDELGPEFGSSRIPMDEDDDVYVSDDWITSRQQGL